MVNRVCAVLAMSVGVLLPAQALADTINPSSYATSLGVGDSVTIRKTVTIEETTSTAVLDVMFVFDVTGSMGSAINNAKSSANTILSELASLGDLRSGSGWYSDPLYNGVQTDLNAGNTGAASGINAIGLCTVGGSNVGCGGDFPEVGYAGIQNAAEDASWRPGSNRFIVALGDASFKDGPSGQTQATTIAALDANDVTALGVSFGTSFTSSMTGLGADVFSSAQTGDLVEAIVSLITGSLSTYSSVTVGDLGAGLPGVGVSVACVSADIGVCDGATAVGDFDRSVARTFEFDVTFTGLSNGLWSFNTHALVDRGIVASEADRITVGDGGPRPVPEPMTLSLLGIGFAGAGLARRRKQA